MSAEWGRDVGAGPEVYEGAGRKVASSWTKWGNTRKRLELGEGEVKARAWGGMILRVCETSKVETCVTSHG